MRALLTVLAAVCLCADAAVGAEPERPLRAGIIGLDTSHVVAFTNAINDPKAEGPLAAVEIIAAFPGGSPDIPSSADRLAGFTEDLRKRGVKIYASIEEMLSEVDVVLLESVDGRPHLAQARPVIAAKKPLFIDKPVAASLADTIEIFRLAKEAGVPVFSSSSLRFSAAFQEIRRDSPVGDVLGCEAYSPCSLEPHHPDLFWYGIHGVEILYTIMGTGCAQVSRVQTEGAELVTGVWADGRIGAYRGIRAGKAEYGATVFGTKAVVAATKYEGYLPLVVEICKFFQTGVSPVPPEETIELVAFMEAADASKRQGGCPVSIASVMEAAQKGR